MKIESMDASYVTTSRSQDVRTQDVKPVSRDSQDVSQTAYSLIENKSISQMTSLEKKELPISEKVVIDAIEKANRAISGGNRKFEFSIHDKTKEIMVKVVDADTNEVIREIPPEKTLDMVAKMWEMAGLIVDERR